MAKKKKKTTKKLPKVTFSIPKKLYDELNFHRRPSDSKRDQRNALLAWLILRSGRPADWKEIPCRTIRSAIGPAYVQIKDELIAPEGTKGDHIFETDNVSWTLTPAQKARNPPGRRIGKALCYRLKKLHLAAGDPHFITCDTVQVVSGFNFMQAQAVRNTKAVIAKDPKIRQALYDAAFRITFYRKFLSTKQKRFCTEHKKQRDFMSDGKGRGGGRVYTKLSTTPVAIKEKAYRLDGEELVNFDLTAGFALCSLLLFEKACPGSPDVAKLHKLYNSGWYAGIDPKKKIAKKSYRRFISQPRPFLTDGPAFTYFEEYAKDYYDFIMLHKTHAWNTRKSGLSDPVHKICEVEERDIMNNIYTDLIALGHGGMFIDEHDGFRIKKPLAPIACKVARAVLLTRGIGTMTVEYPDKRLNHSIP